MNGEVLPAEHGFPARLVVPGLYGYVSATKWLSQIELTRFDEFEGYWIPRGWSVGGPIKTQSRIDVPRRRGPVSAGQARWPSAGWPGPPSAGITKVEVQRRRRTDWDEADLGEEFAATAWRQWKHVITPAGGASTGSGCGPRTGRARPRPARRRPPIPMAPPGGTPSASRRLSLTGLVNRRCRVPRARVEPEGVESPVRRSAPGRSTLVRVMRR